MGNQYYLIFENPLEQNDEVNFGFRVDNLFGNDWQFNHMPRVRSTASFQPQPASPATTPPSSTPRSTCPYLTKGGIDIKGGRFYTILGYEVVPAIGRPLLSVPYMFNYGQPFTHFGMLSTFHLTDRINVYNGAVNGWDRWINENYKWNYLGGFSWTSKDGKANLAIDLSSSARTSIPNFLPISPQIHLPPAQPASCGPSSWPAGAISATPATADHVHDRPDLQVDRQADPGDGDRPVASRTTSRDRAGRDHPERRVVELRQLVPLRLQRQADRRLAERGLPRQRRRPHRLRRQLLRADRWA